MITGYNKMLMLMIFDCLPLHVCTCVCVCVCVYGNFGYRLMADSSSNGDEFVSLPVSLCLCCDAIYVISYQLQLIRAATSSHQQRDKTRCSQYPLTKSGSTARSSPSTPNPRT